MDAKVAVLGASSFSGSAFAVYAADRGAQVFSYSRSRGFDLGVDNSVNDLAKKLLADNPSFIVNFAALNMVAESWAHFQDYYRVNVIGVARLVDLLRRGGWSGRWVQVSTPEVYGAREDKIREFAWFAPSTPYAVSRAAIDMHLSALHHTYGFDVAYTRTVNVYGPSQQPYRIIPKTVLSILRGQKLKLHGGGHSKRSFIHVHDMAAGIFLVMLKAKAGSTYHMSTQGMYSIRDVVDRVCRLMGAKFDQAVEDDLERPGKDNMYLLDDSSIRTNLGWRDIVPFEDGLVETVNWFIKHHRMYDSLEYQHK
jgi:dTDP-glucose 4,6-dehydratase